MAISYDQRKQKYESFDDNQKQQWNNMVNNSKEWDVMRQYMNQYNSETNNTPQSNNSSSNFNNQNGTNWQNQTNFETPTVQKTESQNNNQNNQTYNYDPNEKLDTSMFWASDGKVVVKEWTAQQTWKPDYQLDSDARTREITDNLNAYWQTNREYFQDRNTYNNMFHYNERSDQQKAVLDSYWKKKEDMNVAERYNTADGIKNWMKDAEITPDQLNYIKEYSPEAYREWQQKQLDDINLRIANLATPADPTDNAELFNSLLTKLGLEPWDPYQIYDNWYDMAERLWVFSDSEKLKSYQNQLDQNHSKMEAIMSRYANSTWWTVSDALAAARMNKALAPYQQREVDLQNSYTTLLNGRNSNLAIANQSATALAMQAQEDQRIWNQRLQGLGFAMQTANYRSPEQQAQLQLQTAQIQNDLNLLQTSMQNDLNRYNAYATAKMQNQLQQELTDLSVEDETQLKANLNNALSDYYKNYGDIIQRSQAQAVEDIIAYAKNKGISVAQAMTENFIKPLQNKKEYKNMLAKNYPADTTWQQSWTWVDNGDWTSSLKIQWVGQVPDGLNRSQRISEYKDIYKSVWWDVANFSIALSQAIKDWNTTWWCGEFVNDYTTALWIGKVFGDYLDEKMTKANTDEPTLWSIAIMDFWVKDEDWKPYGHVWIIVWKNPDWSLVITDSNRAWDKKKLTHTLTVADVNKYVKWYYNPNADIYKNSTTTTTTTSSVTDDDIYNYNDATLNRKLTSTQRQKVMDARNEVYSNPDSSMEDILRFSQWGKTPTDSTVQSLDKYAQALTSLWQLTDLLKDANTWPIIWTLRSNNPYDVKAREIDTAIAGLLPTLARWVYGEVWVLTDKDIEHYSQTVPNLKSTSEVNDAILAMSLDMLADWYKRKLATQASLGYDVSGMAWLYQQIITKADELMAWIWASDTNTTTQTQMTYTPIFKTTSFQKYK